MIIGETTLITGISEESKEFIYQCVNDPDLKECTGTLFPVSTIEHEKWIERKALSKNEKLFLILDKMTNEMVGSIGLKNIDYNNSNAELYITIAKPFIGKNGYGTSAINSLVDFTFKRLNLHKIYLQVFCENRRAIKTYERCGFKIEGTLIQHHFDKGTYGDVLLMGIIRGESKDV